MTHTDEAQLQELKQSLRKEAHARRKAQENKDELSREICERFIALPAYTSAQTVMFYVDVRSEVRTRHHLPKVLDRDKRIVVPWCNDAGELELFLLESMDELEVGMY